MDRINLDFEFKFGDDEAKQGSFSGYGAVFGNLDSHGDVIERGAFKDTLRAWEAKGKYPPMLLQHGGGFFGGGADDLLPVGRWTSMEENSKGLKVEGSLFALSTERGQYLYEGLKAGALDGLSIGYRVKSESVVYGTKPAEPRRTLKSIDLVECSIVTFPSNDRSRVGGVKSADIDALVTLSDCTDFLREAGGGLSSKKAANDFVGRVAKIARREAGDDQDVKGLLEHIRSTRRLIIPV